MKKIKWTFEACKNEAFKYESRNVFKNNNVSAYSSARKNGWLNEICSHMQFIRKPKGYWTLDKCIEEALKYYTRKEYQFNSPGSYGKANKNEWLDDICGHMKVKCKPNKYWTKDLCREEALKYINHSDFLKNSGGALTASRKGGWYEEITSHFIIKGNKNKRFIYAYEFPDNHVYVGLTYNITKRQRAHAKKGSVFEHIQSTGLQPIFIRITDTSIEVEEAKKLEGEYLNIYVNNGWIKLNKRITGALGYNYKKWNYDNCKKEALKYQSITDFMNKNKSAYNSVQRNGWADDICKHMKRSRKPSGYWSFEKCLELAKECKSLRDLQIKYATACTKAYKKGWISALKENFINEEETDEN